MSADTVVTRIAPSPTGNLHVGTARSALFNYLYAKKYGGTFIVRVEDTDKERSTKEFERDILDGLAWLGLEHDAVYRQSDRGDIYTAHIQKLLDSEAAYISKEESKQNEGEEIEVVRLKNPGKEITFTDEIRGDITFDTTELGDFVIARSVTDPLYHLAVVIDDADMAITHVIRGEDHISNTPRQILIQEALGFSRPIYAHMPLILAPDRSKLSKRKGETSVSKYAETYLPEALVNYLALLGWNPGTEQELFTLSELVETFDMKGIQKGGAIFDVEKLKSINGEYIKKLPLTKFRELIGELPDTLKTLAHFSEERLMSVLSTLQERVHTFDQARERISEGDLDFYFDTPIYNIEHVAWKDEGLPAAKEHLETVITLLDGLNASSFDESTVKEAIWDYASEKGRGSVLWPMRYALTGKEKTPDPFSIAGVLGKEEVITRLQNAIDKM